VENQKRVSGLGIDGEGRERKEVLEGTWEGGDRG